jgi:thiamine biosynthesis lipoprotein
MTDRAKRALLCAGALALAGCAAHPAVVRRWPVMATYATATIVTASPRDDESVVLRVRDAFDRVNGAMSNWTDRSALQRLNAAARLGAYRIADPELASCVAAALDGAARTGGAFDPTVGPLMTLWGFRPKAPRVPGEEEIAEAQQRVGASKVAYDRAARTIRFADPGMELDLGGIAKGCALDLARRDGPQGIRLEGMLLDLGGQLASWGRSPERGAWKVGVRDPDGESPIVATITLRAGGTVASSSDVEQEFEIGGRRYGHIMDARTGRPADTDVLQSTAIDPSATTGDLLSTALFVAGSSRAGAILRAYPSAEAVLILREGGGLAMLASTSLRGRLAIEAAARHRFTPDSPRFVLPAATMTASANP